MYFYHASQRTKKATSPLLHHYTWICIIGILNISEDIRCCSILSRWFYARTGAARGSSQTCNSRLPFARNWSCYWSGAARRTIQTYKSRLPFARIRSCYWSGAVRRSSQTYDSRRRGAHEDLQGRSIPASRYDSEIQRFPDKKILCQTLLLAKQLFPDLL